MSDKLAGLKEGDRVRITFEGRVVDGLRLRVRPDGAPDNVFWYADLGEAEADTFKVERLAPSFSVGDVVFDPVAGGHATVVGIIERNGGRWLWLDGGPSGFRTRNESAVSHHQKGV